MSHTLVPRYRHDAFAGELLNVGVLIHAPAQADLLPAFERAVAFLADAPGSHAPEVIREEDVDGFVDDFARKAAEHTAKP